MSRTLLILFLGIIAGLAGYRGYLAYRAPASIENLEAQLAWMRTELQLSDEQFGRIQRLHQASHPRLQEIAAQLSHLQVEFAEFERTRQSGERVDFLEFARFVETQRSLNQARLASTKELVLASAEVMTPTQRARYLDWVAPIGPEAGETAN